MNLPKTYSYKEIEEKWYDWWQKKGYFRANPENVLSGRKKPFVVMMPPPNVTGKIHMGHVLDNTIQDIAVRFRRMQGYEVLWQPGTDHAGIATQNKVERELAKEGKTRFDLGREEFLKRVWEWKEKYGNIIVNQLKRLGVSADWSRAKFTMDPDYYEAVITAFVELYKAGLIYRNLYLINWCPRCGTTLADDEVEYREVEGKLWYIRYPLADGSGEVVVATTRPETYLGDTAVAVNPDDERYRHLIGKKVRLPMVDWIRKGTLPDGTEVEVAPEIPIIADRRVDKEFGTGAVKVTPAHDPTDFEIGNEHNLPRVIVMDTEARMNENAGIFEGLDRYEARKRIVELMKEKGYLVKEEEHRHSVGHCYRCGTVIEPYLSEQWFLNLRHFAPDAIKVVKEDRVKIIPERGKKIYFNWMENVRDWPISRQIWWGHRIPVYYGPDGKMFVARTYEEALEEAKKHYGKEVELKQDEDVLDTWFSSALWPFATLGWPKDTPELKAFFPTHLLVTGWDILFFWVARMIVMSLFFMKKEPFRVVYLHGLVRDELRRKMSKSLGNSPDPLDLFDRYSVDGVRMGLMLIAPEGQDIIFSEKRMETGRNYANKLWNIGRFIIGNLEGIEYDSSYLEDVDNLQLEDRWILHHLSRLVKDVTEGLENHEYNAVARALYDFTWSRFADWYIEAIKTREDRERAFSIAAFILDRILRLHHPFMPFITEEIYQYLPTKDAESIMISSWPETLSYNFPEDVEAFEFLMEVIRQVREIKGIFRISPRKSVKLLIDTSRSGEHLARIVKENMRLLNHLARVESIGETGDIVRGSGTVILPGFAAYVPLEGVDVEAEKKRLEKEYMSLRKHVENLKKRLSDENFLNKAPSHVIEAQREKLRDMEEKLSRIEEALKAL